MDGAGLGLAGMCGAGGWESRGRVSLPAPAGGLLAASSSSQLECADREGGHGDHGHRVEHCLAHQLGVVHHLSPHGWLCHDRGRGPQSGCAIYLLV